MANSKFQMPNLVNQIRCAPTLPPRNSEFGIRHLEFKRRPARVARHLLLSLLGVMMLLPFLWMVLASFKHRSEIERLSPFPQGRWHVENYAIVLGLTPDPGTGKVLPIDFKRWYFNSVFIAG